MERQPEVEVATPAHGERLVRVARARLEPGRFSWIWVVDACPFCGQSHSHYAGPRSGDPYRYAGVAVVARCAMTDRRRFLMHAPQAGLWYVLEPLEAPGEA